MVLLALRCGAPEALLIISMLSSLTTAATRGETFPALAVTTILDGV